jgi:D-amino-acid dehydrogenase
VIIENRPGAANTPGAAQVARAKPKSPTAGLRPMMPDMLPRVRRGRNPRVPYNTGHGHPGWALSAATADAVAALATARGNA